MIFIILKNNSVRSHKNSLVSDFWPIFSYLSDENGDDEFEENEFQIAPDNKGENLCYRTKISIGKNKGTQLLQKIHYLLIKEEGLLFLCYQFFQMFICHPRSYFIWQNTFYKIIL